VYQVPYTPWNIRAGEGQMTDVELVRLSAEEIRRTLLEEAKKYRHFRGWQTWEDELLQEFHGKVPRHVLASKLGRTVSMVSHRLEKLGLTRRTSPDSGGFSKKQQPKK
jgi:hypothetical protein